MDKFLALSLVVFGLAMMASTSNAAVVVKDVTYT